VGGNITSTVKVGESDCEDFDRNNFSWECQAVVKRLMNLQPCKGMQLVEH
jgi:hypothetical protein